MVFTLGLRHTFPLWQRRASLGTIFVVQDIAPLLLGRCRKNLPLYAPSVMESPILPLIEAYQSHVAEACELFRSNLGVTGNILAAWRRIPIGDYDSDDEPSIPGSGTLDPKRNVTYSFHGIGCRVMFGSLDVDFDFGPHGRHDGFDSWRLHMYAKSAKPFRELSDQNVIQTELDAMERENFIQHLDESLGSHLYYFTSSLDCD